MLKDMVQWHNILNVTCKLISCCLTIPAHAEAMFRLRITAFKDLFPSSCCCYCQRTDPDCQIIAYVIWWIGWKLRRLRLCVCVAGGLDESGLQLWDTESLQRELTNNWIKIERKKKDEDRQTARWREAGGQTEPGRPNRRTNRQVRQTGWQKINRLKPREQSDWRETEKGSNMRNVNTEKYAKETKVRTETWYRKKTAEWENYVNEKNVIAHS